MANKISSSLHPLRYVLDHWRGHQSLFQSFWINLIALRVLIFQLHGLLAPAEGENFSEWRILVLVCAGLAHGLLLLWQVVGVVRAADRHFSSHGNMALVWGAQLGVTVMLLLSAVYSLGAVQMTFDSTPEKNERITSSADRLVDYRLSVSSGGTQMEVEGVIEPGITRAASRLIEANPTIVRVRLHSQGGNIYEGRGLSRLFARHGLSTHVDELCASACTTAYIGGQYRSAAAQAKFGFHQYRLDGGHTIIIADTASEQLRDETLFLDAGVDGDFVRLIFSHPASDMWWPSLNDLQAAKVVHEVES